MVVSGHRIVKFFPRFDALYMNSDCTSRMSVRVQLFYHIARSLQLFVTADYQNLAKHWSADLMVYCKVMYSYLYYKSVDIYFSEVVIVCVNVNSLKWNTNLVISLGVWIINIVFMWGLIFTKNRNMWTPYHKVALIHSIGMCRILQFLAILRSFFHSPLLCTFSCHPSPLTILPSSLTSSCHLFQGLPFNLVSKTLNFQSCSQIHIYYSFGNSIFFHSLYMPKPS